MYKILLFSFALFTFLSCKDQHNTVLKNTTKTNYFINGQAFDKEQETILLILLENKQLVIKDSTRIQQNKFNFSGTISYPHKALLQLKNHESSFTFILDKDSCQIELNTLQMQSSSISNSAINDELKVIRKQSEEIYRKIDYLFPQLQKARMENDYMKLEEINIKINNIIIENQEFLYHYIHQNFDQYLSGLLLNDLWLSTEKDSIKLQNLAKRLSPNVQKTLSFTIH